MQTRVVPRDANPRWDEVLTLDGTLGDPLEQPLMLAVRHAAPAGQRDVTLGDVMAFESEEWWRWPGYEHELDAVELR